MIRAVVSRKYETGLEKSLLAYTEIELNSDYELEGESSTGSALLLYSSSLPTPLLPSLSPINSLPTYNMSCHDANLEQIIQQQ